MIYLLIALLVLSPSLSSWFPQSQKTRKSTPINLPSFPFRPKLFTSLNKFTDSRKVKADVIPIGSIANQIYTGHWKSSLSSQNNFIKSQTGKFQVAISSQSDNFLLLQVLFYSNEFIDSNNIATDQAFRVDSVSQSNFSKTSDLFIERRSHFYFNSDASLCEVNIDFSFTKHSGEPVKITSDNIKDLLVTGKIESEDCQISLIFHSEYKPVDHKQAIVITVLCALSQLTSILAILKIIRQNNNNQTLIINDWITGLHVAMDFGLFYFNLFFGTSYMPGYSLYLMLIGFVHFVSSFIKNFLFGRQFAAYIAQGRFTPRQRKVRRIWFFMKILLVVGVGICFSLFLFQFSLFYYIFFLYPIIQVIHNCTGLSKEHLFIWWLHIPVFTSYVLFFCCMKGFHSFFNFEYSYGFIAIVCSEVFVCMVIMIFQRILEPLFFLPKSMRPGYYDYYRKFETCPVDPEATCAICLLHIHDDPLDGGEQDGTQEKLLHDSFMETPCGHRFHSTCLKEWILINQICPLCKKKIPVLM